MISGRLRRLRLSAALTTILAVVLSAVFVERAAAQTAATSSPAPLGGIYGVVYDSLLNRGLAGAVVSLAGTSKRRLTDSLGRFDFDSLASSDYGIVVRHPLLDSLGIGGFNRRVTVAAGTPVSVTLAVQSLATLKHGACADSMNLLTGVVRDVTTLKPMLDAKVFVQWLGIEHSASGQVRGATQGIVGSALADGRYFLCIAPSVEVTASAAEGPTRSGQIPVETTPRRFMALDLYVDAASADSARSSNQSSTDEPHPSAILVGHVRDTLGRAVSGAIVAINDLEGSATTDSAGFFTLSSPVAGSRAVTVHRIGYGPIQRAVVLAHGRLSNVTVVLEPVTTLRGVDITASSDSRFSLRSEFADRKKAGFGYLFGPDDIAALHPSRTETLLQNVPGVIISYWPIDKKDTTAAHRHPPGSLLVNFQEIVQLGGTYCEANVYVDGVYTQFQEDLRALAPDQIAAIEVYKQSSEAPGKYVNLRNGCGVILIWTTSTWRR